MGKHTTKGPMTERSYLLDIKKKCMMLGTWRDEFERPQRRLAKIYARTDEVETAYRETGSRPVIEHTNKNGSVNLVRNPMLRELDTLYDQALTYERELGMTPAALKRITDEAGKREEDGDAFAKLLSGE